MKVICDSRALLDAVNIVSGVIATRTTRPQLTGVKLTAAKKGGAGELSFAGTDTEISLALSTSRVEVETPGEALIPADKLRQIVSAEESDPTLTIEMKDSICHIRGNDAHFRIHGFDPADFPAIAALSDPGEIQAKATITCPASRLGSMIARTLFATARENSRYAINGVLINRKDGKLEMVATDGRRLALARSTTEGAKSDPAISCIVPTKALGMVQRLIDDPDEPIRLDITDNQVVFTFGQEGEGDGVRAVLAANLVEGAFPPYEDVIPKDQDKRVVVDRDVLSSAMRRAALLTNEESRGVRMIFKNGRTQVEFTSRAPEVGEAEIKAELASYDGEDLEIGFNPNFIIDPLKVMSESEVIIELKDASKQAIMRSGGDFTYVVMPVSLS